MDALQSRRTLLLCWVVAGSILVGGIVWDRVIAHAAYRNMPRGAIVDYAQPVVVRAMIAIGFWGLIVVAIAGVALYVTGKLRPEE